MVYVYICFVTFGAILGSTFGVYGMIFGIIFAFAIIGSTCGFIIAATDESVSDFPLDSDDEHDFCSVSGAVNPATGFLMIGGVGGVDTGGNSFGSGSDDLFTFDDSMSSSFEHDMFETSSFGDDFNSGSMDDGNMF